MYNGIVNVYKEQGYTSHDVVAKLRGIFGQKKVGHTGTLDPMAEGVLIVVLGKATKLSDIIVSSTKRYIAQMQLGIVTDTDDITGEVTQDNSGLSEKIFKDEEDFKVKIEEACKEFLGKSMQIPPMYSAIKKDGKKLYEYARNGETIEREARPIEIYKLEPVSYDFKELKASFVVECSKGTYIRSLIRDIGEKLGIGATMSGLLRDENNSFRAEDGLKISDLQNMKEEGRLADAVVPMDRILTNIPMVNITKRGEVLLTNGNRLTDKDFEISKLSDSASPCDDKSVHKDIDILRSAEFFRVYMNSSLMALYTYDKEKGNYKVYKML